MEEEGEVVEDGADVVVGTAGDSAEAAEEVTSLLKKTLLSFCINVVFVFLKKNCKTFIGFS
jgi:hypothetical protein